MNVIYSNYHKLNCKHYKIIYFQFLVVSTLSDSPAIESKASEKILSLMSEAISPKYFEHVFPFFEALIYYHKKKKVNISILMTLLRKKIEILESIDF